MLNESNKRGHDGLVLNFKGNTVGISPLNTTLGVGFLDMLLINRQSHSIPDLLRVFLMNGHCTLSDVFSGSAEVIMCFFFWLLYMVDNIGFQMFHM